MNKDQSQQENLDQDAHDAWLAKQSDQDLRRMAVRLGDLARFKAKNGTLSSGDVLSNTKSDAPKK